MVNKHLEEMEALTKKGVGLVCLHYAVEVPKGQVGDKFLDWIGGYFEANWSVNPHWTATFAKLPEHPITSWKSTWKSCRGQSGYLRWRASSALAGVLS